VPFLLKGLAGAIIGIVAVTVAINLIKQPASTGPGPGAGDVHTNGQVSFFSLRTGACFQNPAGNALMRGVTVDVTAVPCTTAHNAQIYAQFRATGGVTYPGRTALDRQSAHDCRSTLASRVRRSKVNSETIVVYLIPDSTSWFTGRRTISCVVIDSTRDMATSVLKARAPA
jgi:hypothetical protein